MHRGIELLDSGPLRSETHEPIGTHLPVLPVLPDSTAPPQPREGSPRHIAATGRFSVLSWPPPEGYPGYHRLIPAARNFTTPPTSSCHAKLHCAARADEYPQLKVSPRESLLPFRALWIPRYLSSFSFSFSSQSSPTSICIKP
jgi:hypothetical protein